jgi:hypothetical protein
MSIRRNSWSKMFRLNLEAGNERGISLPTGPFGNCFAMVAIYVAAPASFRQNIDKLCDALLIGYHLASARHSLQRNQFPRRAFSSCEQECLSWVRNGKTACGNRQDHRDQRADRPFPRPERHGEILRIFQGQRRASKRPNWELSTRTAQQHTDGSTRMNAAVHTFSRQLSDIDVR